MMVGRSKRSIVENIDGLVPRNRSLIERVPMKLSRYITEIQKRRQAEVGSLQWKSIMGESEDG